MTSPTSYQVESAPEISAHADAALRTVRVVLGVLSCFVLGAYRPLSGSLSWPSVTLVLTSIIASVVVLNYLAKHLPRRAPWIWVSQALDVAATVALAIALYEPLEQQSWALLIVPVVSAAVRHGSAASVLSWVGGCVGYIVAAFTGAVDSSDGVTLLARVPGVLLAVAITVGLLARWMREGWEIQNALTATVAAREHRLAVIEQAGHALKDLPSQEALELCASQALALGFDSATVEDLTRNRPMFSVGACEIIAASRPEDRTSQSQPVVTVWVENDDVVAHSICVHEPETRSVLTGWSANPIDEDQAQALVTLVAHTSTAIETSSLLRRLRYSSAHDELTGLANRRTLDQLLEREARESSRLALAFIDLDDFKSINDQHGHDIGDKALVSMARRLEAAAGPAGVVARYGGDEFVILLPDATMEEAYRVAQNALRSSTDVIALGPLQLLLGISVGIAAAEAPIAAAKLIRTADQALYKAKAAGKGSIVAVDIDATPSSPQRAEASG